MTNLGRIGDLQDFYLLESHLINKRSTEKSHEHHALLGEDEAVVWFEQQLEKKR